MDEFPPPVRLPGESPARARPPAGRRHETTDVVDEDVDSLGAEAAAAELSAQLQRVRAAPARRGDVGRVLLSPPFTDRDHVDGPASARATLIVLGALGTPGSQGLGGLLDHVRLMHPETVAIAWRHYPDPVAHPRATILALATEAAATRGRFWALTGELLAIRHHEPPDLRTAMRHVGLDPAATIAAMRAGTGADRIRDDVASAMASGVAFTPALFIDGERYEGPESPAAVSEELARAADRG